MASKSIQELENLLNSVALDLPKVTSRKMFGCYALWADENVFALIWKTGRLGLKLPESKDYEVLLNLPGAEPWKAGPMQMAHWILIPESLYPKKSELKKWVQKAYDHCLKLEKKPQKKTSTKKSPVKKTSKKVITKKGKK